MVLLSHLPAACDHRHRSAFCGGDTTADSVQSRNTDGGPINRTSVAAADVRRRISGGSSCSNSHGTAPLSRRLLLIFALLSVISVYCSRVAMAATLTSSSRTTGVQFDSDDESLSSVLASSESRPPQQQQQLIDIIARLLQEDPSVRLERQLQFQRQTDGRSDYGPRSAAAASVEAALREADDETDPMVDVGGVRWSPEQVGSIGIVASKDPEVEDRTGRGRRPRLTAKRGPGVCINSCLTGGMTFVRCKSMCH